MAQLLLRLRPPRQDLLALTLLALLALAFFWPVTLGLGWIPRGGGDLASFLWPTYSYAAQSLRAGRVPLWNPALYSGAPFAADNQSGVFYPLNLLFFLLWPGFPYRAIEWLVIAHVWLAGAGMYALIRALGAGRPAALFAAVAYMFSDVFVTHVGNLNIIAVAAWLPLAFAGLHLGLTRRSAGWAAAGGAALGVAALAGHAQMTLIVAGGLGLYGLWSALTAPGARAGLGRLGLLALAFALALGLSALAVLPAAEMAAFTGRARLEYAAAAEYSLPWAGLAGLFSPLILGRGAAGFWAPWPRVELGYLGLLPLFFAGLASFRGWRGLPVFLLGLAAFGLLAALGENTPFHRLLYDLVPGMSQLRVPARFILLTDFALAVLGGLGLERAFGPEAERPGGRGVLAWALGLLAAGLGLGLLGYRAAAAQAGASHIGGLLAGLAVMAGLLGLGLGLWRLRGWRGAAWLAVGLLAADLIGHGAWVEVDRDDPTLGYQHPQVVDFLLGQPDPTRMDNAASAWAPDAAARFGLEDIGGLSNPLALAAYQTYAGAVGARGSPLYNFLNAQFVVADKGRPPGDSALVPVFDADPALDVYLNTRALPRVSLVHSARPAADGEAAFALIHAADFDPAAQVVVEGLSAPQPPPAAEGQANLYYLDYAPEAFRIVAVTPSPAYLVLSEVWYPGWRAWLDGAEVPIWRANFAFRAVYLPAAGEHVLEMRFDPWSWKAGLAVTGLSLALSALWVARRARDSCQVYGQILSGLD